MIVNKEIISYRINQARLSRGLSMSELADLVDVSKQAINQYETGKIGIAHEIGHLLIHAGNIPPEDIVKDIVHKKLEDEANRFAGAFLLPKETFQYDVFKTSIDHFIQLKAKWKVSLSAMVYRCNTLDLHTTSQLKYLNDQMTQRVYWHHEPLDNEMPIERPFAHKQA